MSFTTRTFREELDAIQDDVDSGMVELPPRFRAGFVFEQVDAVERVVAVVARELGLPEIEPPIAAQRDRWSSSRPSGPDYGKDRAYVELLAYCVPAIERFMDVLPDDDDLDLASKIFDRFDLYDLCRLRDRLQLRRFRFVEDGPDTLGDVEDAMKRTLAPWLKDRLLRAARGTPAARQAGKKNRPPRSRDEVRAERQSGGKLGC